MKFWRLNCRTEHVRERRLDQRKPTALRAAVCWEHDHTRQCRITSLSLTGMFLELPETSIAIGTQLQLFFYCTMDDSKKLCCDWVSVVGRRANGVAVSFARFDNQHQNNIQLMLQQAVPHPFASASTNTASQRTADAATTRKSA